MLEIVALLVTGAALATRAPQLNRMAGESFIFVSGFVLIVGLLKCYQDLVYALECSTVLRLGSGLGLVLSLILLVIIRSFLGDSRMLIKRREIYSFA
jgi:hypothetical protein